MRSKHQCVRTATTTRVCTTHAPTWRPVAHHSINLSQQLCLSLRVLHHTEQRPGQHSSSRLVAWMMQQQCRQQKYQCVRVSKSVNEPHTPLHKLGETHNSDTVLCSLSSLCVLLLLCAHQPTFK